MPQCCPQSPLYFLYPGRPMEQSFSYTRDNIPPIPPITKEMKPQIPHGDPLPFKGPEPQKMAAVEPELRIDDPKEWWNIPSSNFPGESLPKQDEYDMDPLHRPPPASSAVHPYSQKASNPSTENYKNLNGNHHGPPGRRLGRNTSTKMKAILLSLVMISLIFILIG